MAPELVYLVAAVWRSVARFDRHFFMFLSCSQRQMISTDSVLVFSNYRLLIIANQMARDHNLTVLLLVFGFFLAEMFPIYHFPTINFNLS